MEQQDGFPVYYPGFASTTSMECTFCYSDSKAKHDRICNMLRQMSQQATLSMKLIIEKVLRKVARGLVPIEVETRKFVREGTFDKSHHTEGSLVRSAYLAFVEEIRRLACPNL